MSNDDLRNLVERYLAGEANDEEVRQLDALIRSDASTRRELLLAAGLETDLRALLGGPSVRESQALPAPKASAGCRRALRYAVAAGVLLAVMGGWIAAVWTGRELDQARKRIASLERRPPSPAAETSDASRTAPPVASGQPRVFSTRGLVLALAQEPGGQPQPIAVGSAAPADRRLWTCPWGAAATCYDDGTSVSLDRSTVAGFSESDGTRRVMLANGILFVNRWPATKDRADMVFQTTLASVTVKNALATIVAERGRTLVEVGENEVFVLGASEAGGEPVRVPAGHYAVVVRNGTVQVKKGLLAWRLEP